MTNKILPSWRETPDIQMAIPIAMKKNPHRWMFFIVPSYHGKWIYEPISFWKAVEAPGVESVFPKKDQAIDYAQNRACFRSGEIRVLDLTGKLERPRPKYYVALAVEITAFDPPR
jgi:hypothetical protein